MISCSWVFIPLWLMFDSYTHIAGALRAQQGASKAKRSWFLFHQAHRGIISLNYIYLIYPSRFWKLRQRIVYPFFDFVFFSFDFEITFSLVKICFDSNQLCPFSQIVSTLVQIIDVFNKRNYYYGIHEAQNNVVKGKVIMEENTQK